MATNIRKNSSVIMNALNLVELLYFGGVMLSLFCFMITRVLD